MLLSIVVAVAKDGAIGKGNDLLWHLPGDLKRFKALTTGHTILMGRKTFESLPNGPLPQRRNVVISRSLQSSDGVEVFPSIEEALTVLSESDDEVFVIGGGEIYRQLLGQAQRIYLTEVDASFPDAEVFFPELQSSDWEEVQRTTFPRDERNEYERQLVVLHRRN
ncbi:dihydrofolate reductase [uncultured Porphyromonas sp.]|uniref:dihydrofolate reductase n=1 Tax=uncultured Porphyromonas sp. TaxID=159274 RepID=UPI00261D7439|nr:dihydrofolate reductase [uncultured Porphyromonas sp.]